MSLEGIEKIKNYADKYGSDEYLPESQEKTGKKQIKVKWTLEENKIYAQFLVNNLRLFEDEYTRRTTKVFKGISNAIGTKLPKQCKSHHQKMIKRYRTLSSIIQALGQTPELRPKPSSKTIDEGQQSILCLSTDLEKNENKFQEQFLRNILFKSALEIKSCSSLDLEGGIFDVLDF